MPIWKRREQPKPDLVQMILPPYEVPDLIVTSGVVVENRGRASAKNIRIMLEYDKSSANRIRHFQVQGNVEYFLLSGGEQQSFVTLSVRQLGAGQNIVIYFSGPDRVQPQVQVTYSEE